LIRWRFGPQAFTFSADRGGLQPPCHSIPNLADMDETAPKMVLQKFPLVEVLNFLDLLLAKSAKGLARNV
jgi:hypothetical protein